VSKSIMQDEKVCYISGSPVDLERHHVYYGAGRRKLSDKYGLTVWLRHDLHNEPPYGVHHCKQTRRMLEQAGQRAFQEHYPDLDFMKIFGRNYL
jgi:hypothetical protein